MRISAENSVRLNAENTYRGITEISGGSRTVEVNAALSLGNPAQGTRVRGAEVNLNVATNEPLVVIDRGRVYLEVQQSKLPRIFSTGTSRPTGLQTVAINTPGQYDEMVDVVEGQLEINADTTLRGVTVRNDGQLRVTGTPTAPKHLGQVRIAGGGALGERGRGFFSFDQILLEEGNLIPGQLVGSGDIVKETLGSSRISADPRSTYNGVVMVNDGRLQVGGLSEAKFLVNGGKLVLPVGGNEITLTGRRTAKSLWIK